MNSKVSLKYFVHDCLVECESFDRFWTLRPLSQLYQKIGGSEFEKCSKIWYWTFSKCTILHEI